MTGIYELCSFTILSNSTVYIRLSNPTPCFSACCRVPFFCESGRHPIGSINIQGMSSSTSDGTGSSPSKSTDLSSNRKNSHAAPPRTPSSAGPRRPSVNAFFNKHQSTTKQQDPSCDEERRHAKQQRKHALHRVRALPHASLQAMAHILCLPISPPPPAAYGIGALKLHQARQKAIREAITRLPVNVQLDKRDQVPWKSKVAGLLNQAASAIETSTSVPEKLKVPVKASIDIILGLDFLRQKTPLCHTHVGLRPKLVHALFTSLIAEVSVRLEVFVLGFPGLRPEYQQFIHTLRTMQALWLPPSQYRPSSLDRWSFQADRCEACVLARVGGDDDSVRALRAAVLSRAMSDYKPGARGPHFLPWIDAWVDEMSPEKRTAVRDWSDRVGGEMRIIRAKEKYNRRVRKAAERGEPIPVDPFRESGGTGAYDDGENQLDSDFEDEIIQHYAELLSRNHLPLDTQRELHGGEGTRMDMLPATTYHPSMPGRELREQDSPGYSPARSTQAGFVYPPFIPSPSSVSLTRSGSLGTRHHRRTPSSFGKGNNLERSKLPARSSSLSYSRSAVDDLQDHLKAKERDRTYNYLTERSPARAESQPLHRRGSSVTGDESDVHPAFRSPRGRDLAKGDRERQPSFVPARKEWKAPSSSSSDKPLSSTPDILTSKAPNRSMSTTQASRPRAESLSTTTKTTQHLAPPSYEKPRQASSVYSCATTATSNMPRSASVSAKPGHLPRNALSPNGPPVMRVRASHSVASATRSRQDSVTDVGEGSRGRLPSTGGYRALVVDPSSPSASSTRKGSFADRAAATAAGNRGGSVSGRTGSIGGRGTRDTRWSDVMGDEEGDEWWI